MWLGPRATWPLGAEKNLQLMPSKKTETSVLQPQTLNFANDLREPERGPNLQIRMQL